MFFHPANAGTVWVDIWAIGQPKGLTPLGLEAPDMLRIEAGLIFAGYEFCDQTNPVEVGLGFTVPPKTTEADFIARHALVRGTQPSPYTPSTPPPAPPPPVPATRHLAPPPPAPPPGLLVGGVRCV